MSRTFPNLSNDWMFWLVVYSEKCIKMWLRHLGIPNTVYGKSWNSFQTTNQWSSTWMIWNIYNHLPHEWPLFYQMIVPWFHIEFPILISRISHFHPMISPQRRGSFEAQLPDPGYPGYPGPAPGREHLEKGSPKGSYIWETWQMENIQNHGNTLVFGDVIVYNYM